MCVRAWVRLRRLSKEGELVAVRGPVVSDEDGKAETSLGGIPSVMVRERRLLSSRRVYPTLFLSFREEHLLFDTVRATRWRVGSAAGLHVPPGTFTAENADVALHALIDGGRAEERVSDGWFLHLLRFLAGVLSQSSVTEHRVLPVGAIVTLVGKLRVSDGHAVLTAHPALGVRCLSDDLATWITRLQRAHIRTGLWSAAAAVAAATLLRWALGRRPRGSADEPEAAAPEELTGEDVPASSPQEQCVVCMDSLRKVAFFPCGHRCCCIACANHVRTSRPECPLCRAHISNMAVVFE